MLGQAGVSVRMISQSCDEINIIIGVEEKDFDLAIGPFTVPFPIKTAL